MLSHITLRVKDLEESKQFFCVALVPLGMELLYDKHETAGFGQRDKKGTWSLFLKQGEAGEVKSFSCLAFASKSKEEVQQFHAAALTAGGSDNGTPGYRPHYHTGYYAAYVTDPNGYNIEVAWDDVERMRT